MITTTISFRYYIITSHVHLNHAISKLIARNAAKLPNTSVWSLWTKLIQHFPNHHHHHPQEQDFELWKTKSWKLGSGVCFIHYNILAVALRKNTFFSIIIHIIIHAMRCWQMSLFFPEKRRGKKARAFRGNHAITEMKTWKTARNSLLSAVETSKKQTLSSKQFRWQGAYHGITDDHLRGRPLDDYDVIEGNINQL